MTRHLAEGAYFSAGKHPKNEHNNDYRTLPGVASWAVSV